MLGDRVRFFKDMKGLNTKELAEIAGLTPAYVSMIERNKRTNPSTESLEKIASALGVTLEDLFKSDEDSQEIQEIQGEDNLTEKDKKDIYKDVNKILDKLNKKEDGPIYYNGDELSEEDVDLFADALELALKTIKVKNKEKYTPKKYKK